MTHKVTQTGGTCPKQALVMIVILVQSTNERCVDSFIMQQLLVTNCGVANQVGTGDATTVGGVAQGRTGTPCEHVAQYR